MSERQLYIIAYDISDPRRLRHSLNILKDYAWGGQKSVFECFLTPAEKNSLCQRIKSSINEQEDFLLAFKVVEPCQVRTLGIGIAPRDEPLFYVG